MPDSLKKLRIFVASPSDVASERAKLETVAESLKPTADNLGLILEVLDWRAVVPDAGRPQQVIFDQLNPTSWDIFIGILWHRFGTPPGAKDKTGKDYLSGTEEEFKTAYELWKQYGKPRMVLYRCTRALPLDVETDQFRNVQEFFKLIEDVKGDFPTLYQAFDTTESFEKLVHNNLQKLLFEYGDKLKKSGDETRENDEEVNYFKTTYQLKLTDRPILFSPPALAKNILERCLQTPFGGRDREFAKIENFTNEKDSGYIFITGVSGIGKTTLMGRVIERLAKQNISPIYHFISRRDGTAGEEDFMRGLCRQLANYFKLEGVLPESLSEIRALYLDLLTRIPVHNTRLVIVIDGLDEADGWLPNRNIFPLTLSKGVFVVFSARRIANTDWLAQLELARKNRETIELDVFRKEEIIEVFHSAGGRAASWIDGKKFCSDVVNVSLGDPFYIQYLITDIDDGRITPDNVGNEPKGLEPYLDRWWESIQSEFEDSRVKDLLGYLAVARNPLDWNDLANIDDSTSLNELTLDTALGKAKRFILGDRQTGYSLSHPRFQDYIARKFQKTLTQYEEKLVEYCRTTWKNHNKYSLRNLISHLFDGKKYDEIHSLLTQPEFMRAKRLVFGSHYNFLEDINRAIKICEELSFTELPHLIFYSLLQSILRTQTANIAPEVLRVLAELGELERAINYAKSIADPLQKATAFQYLGGGGWDSEYYFGRKQKKLNYDGFLLERAYDEVQNIQRFHDRAEFLRSLAPDLARIGNAEKAFLCVEEIGSKYPDDDEYLWFKNDAQRKIPIELARAGKKQEALTAIEKIEDEYHRNEALEEVVRALAESGMIEAAFDIAVNNPNQPDIIKKMSRGVGFREDWLKDVVEKAKALNQKDRAIFFDDLAAKMRPLIQEAKTKDQNQILNQENRYMTAERARLFAWLGQYNTAFVLLKSLEKNNFWMYSTDWVDLLATSLLIDNRKDDVQYLAKNEWTSHHFDDFQVSISSWEETESEFNKLLDKRRAGNMLISLLKKRPYKLEFSPAIQSLSVHLVEAGYLDVLLECFKSDLYEDYHGSTSYDTELSNIVTQLARRKMFDEAETLIKKIDDHWLKSAFSNLAGAFIGADKYNAVVPAAKRLISKPYERYKVVASIADFYANENKSKALIILEEALIDAEAPLETLAYRNKALVSVARELSIKMEFEKALVVSEYFMISEPFEYSDITSDYISKSSVSKVSEFRLSEVIGFISQVPENEQRQALLCFLSASLALRGFNELSASVIEKVDEDYSLKAYAIAMLAGKTFLTNENLANEYISHALKMAKSFEKPIENQPEKEVSREGDEAKSDHLSEEIDVNSSDSETESLPDLSILRLWSSINSYSPDLRIEDSVRTASERLKLLGHPSDSDYITSLIMSALLVTGWTKKALDIYDGAEPEWFREAVLNEEIYYYAVLGDYSNAYKILNHLKKVSRFSSAETNIELILRGIEHFQFAKSKKYGESEKMAKELVAIFEAKRLFSRSQKNENEGSDDFSKDELSAELFESLSLAYLQNGYVKGVIDILKQIPDDILEIRLITQIKCILFFLDKNEYLSAEAISSTIEEQQWKEIADKLIQCKNSADDKNKINQLALSALRDLRNIRQSTRNLFVRSWIPSATIDILLLGDFSDTLSIAGNFEYLEHNNDIKEKLMLRLVQKGMIDDAFTVFNKLDFTNSYRGYELQIIKQMAVKLLDLPVDKALGGIRHILKIVRSREYEFTYEIISCIIPVIQKHGGSESVWSVFSALTRIDSFWT